MLNNKKKKEKEVIIILCKPSFKLSKIAIDYLESQGKTKSIVTLMLEDAEIKFCHGIKSRPFEILKSNIRKNVTQEIVVVTIIDLTRFTLKEHYQFLECTLSILSRAFPMIKINGMAYNDFLEKFYVFK